MTDPVRLRGIELRYALTLFLFQNGRCTVRELIDGLTWQGFEFSGIPSKAVSDALRERVREARCRSEAGTCGGGS